MNFYHSIFQTRWAYLLPILLMVIVTPFTPYLDLKITRYYYSLGAKNVSHFVSHPWFDFLYSYALIPGQILAILSMVALFCAYLIPSCRQWKKPALVSVLTIAIGAGFLCHFILKDHWGRPRPRQVIEFGGQQPFRPYFEPNFFHQPEPSKSFPCGHCTMGFYFFATALLAARYGRKYLAWLAFIFALILGTALGITRMAQGGHFLSDVLMSALLMWLTALTFDGMIYRDRDWAD